MFFFLDREISLKLGGELWVLFAGGDTPAFVQQHRPRFLLLSAAKTGHFRRVGVFRSVEWEKWPSLPADKEFFQARLSQVWLGPTVDAHLIRWEKKSIRFV